MAKKANKGTSVNVALLQSIANATEVDKDGNKIGRITQAEYVGHEQFITVNTSDVVDNKAAAILTDAGKQYLNNLNSGDKESAGKPMFGVMKGIPIPASQKGNRKGAGAPTQYPFETMEVGDTFFVGNSQKKEALKSLGSTVSQQNMKYRTEIPGEFEDKQVTKRGTGNKAVLDEAGNKVKETKRVPKYKQDRKFVLRGIKAGQQLGDWTAPEDGALVGREA